MPELGFFGVTASTGDHGDAHVVYNLQAQSPHDLPMISP